MTTYKVRIASIAETEMLDAMEYYDRVNEGLGNALKLELDSAITRICNFPLISELVSKNVRRHLVPRFSYAIFYQVVQGEKEIRILAIGHQHREPAFWHGRQ